MVDIAKEMADTFSEPLGFETVPVSLYITPSWIGAAVVAVCEPTLIEVGEDEHAPGYALTEVTVDRKGVYDLVECLSWSSRPGWSLPQPLPLGVVRSLLGEAEILIEPHVAKHGAWFMRMRFYRTGTLAREVLLNESDTQQIRKTLLEMAGASPLNPYVSVPKVTPERVLSMPLSVQ